MAEVRKIPVTKDNLWFLQRQISIFDILEFFPMDAIGGPGEKPDPKARLLTIRTDAGFTIQTDIRRDRLILRNRSKADGTGRWMMERQVKEGDYICFEKLGDYEYYMYKESPGEKGQ